MKEIVVFCLVCFFSADAEVKRKPSHCQDVMEYSDRSGPYTVFVGTFRKPVRVYCDMDTDGGGWTVVLRREDGSESFDRTWVEYQKGFGNPNKEYWMGLEALHLMTAVQNFEMRADLRDFNGENGTALYDHFSVCGEDDDYRLRLGNYTGAIDVEGSDYDVGFRYNNGQGFSTRDNDKDGSSWTNCAAVFHSGWWFKSCTYVNLNGPYMGRNYVGRDGIAWFNWKKDQSLEKAEMKIRPVIDLSTPLK